MNAIKYFFGNPFLCTVVLTLVPMYCVSITKYNSFIFYYVITFGFEKTLVKVVHKIAHFFFPPKPKNKIV